MNKQNLVLMLFMFGVLKAPQNIENFPENNEN